MHHVGRRSHVAVGQLRDVHQPVLLDADVDETRPKAVMLVTMPGSSMPSRRSPIVCTSGVECEDLQAARAGRAPVCRAPRGCPSRSAAPASPLTYRSGLDDRCAAVCRLSRRSTVTPASAAIRSTTAYDSGCTALLSSGFACRPDDAQEAGPPARRPWRPGAAL